MFSLTVKPRESHAWLPVLYWIGGAIVSEVAVSLGWKYAAKPVYQAIKDRVTKKVVDNADDFDFSKKKTVKKKNGTVSIPASKLDKSKIATLLKEESKTIIKADQDRKSKMSNPQYSVDYAVSDPFFSTGVALNFIPYSFANSEDYEAIDFIKSFVNIEFAPIPYQSKSRVSFVSNVTNKSLLILEMRGGSPNVTYNIKVDNVFRSYEIEVPNSSSIITSSVGGTTTWPYLSAKADTEPEYALWKKYLSELQNNNRTIYVSQGLIVPSDNTKIYDIPLETPSDFKLLTDNTLKDGIDIDINLETDTDIDLIDDNITTELQTALETTINNYETTNLDYTVNNTYNYNTTINNYYTQEEGESSNEELMQQIAELIKEMQEQQEQQEESIDNDTDVAPPDAENDFSDLKNLVTQKFPFSLPWDLLYLVDLLDANSEVPEFKMHVKGSIFGMSIPIKVEHKMDYLEPFMPFLHFFLKVAYLFMLVMITRKLLGGAA